MTLSRFNPFTRWFLLSISIIVVAAVIWVGQLWHKLSALPVSLELKLIVAKLLLTHPHAAFKWLEAISAIPIYMRH